VRQSARQPLFAKVEELVDQAFLDSNVSCQRVGYEPAEVVMLFAGQTKHVSLRNHKGRGSHNPTRRVRRSAHKASFLKELARPHDPYDILFAGLPYEGSDEKWAVQRRGLADKRSRRKTASRQLSARLESCPGTAMLWITLCPLREFVALARCSQ